MGFQEQHLVCAFTNTVFQPHRYKSVHQEIDTDIQASFSAPFFFDCLNSIQVSSSRCSCLKCELWLSVWKRLPRTANLFNVTTVQKCVISPVITKKHHLYKHCDEKISILFYKYTKTHLICLSPKGTTLQTLQSRHVCVYALEVAKQWQRIQAL